jgi:hypothetical protein
MKLKRAGRVAAVLAAVCGAGLSSAGAAAATQTVAWGTTNSAPAGALGELFGVAAASRTEVLAVGGFNPGQPPTAVLTNPYAERWNGTAWARTPVPLGQVYPSQAAQLNGAAAVGPGDSWAVGTAWTRFPTPDPAGPAQPNSLAAVAARSTADVWAAGAAGFPDASLVLHWNGHAWRQVTVPNIGRLAAVATAPGRVWVAGGNKVEQFNGTAWTTLPALPFPGQTSVNLAGLADTPSGLWAVGALDFSCGEGQICTSSYAAVWNGTAWTEAPGAPGTGLSGVTAAGSQVLATFQDGVVRLTRTGATAQVTPALNSLVLTAIAADPAGNPWAAGSLDTQGKIQPAIINAPGIGQGGIIVTTGASGATVTWAGPVTGAGSTDFSGQFAVGGLPDGSYTVTASLPDCQPGIATAVVNAGIATPVNAHISC